MGARNQRRLNGSKDNAFRREAQSNAPRRRLRAIAPDGRPSATPLGGNLEPRLLKGGWSQQSAKEAGTCALPQQWRGKRARSSWLLKPSSKQRRIKRAATQRRLKTGNPRQNTLKDGKFEFGVLSGGVGQTPREIEAPLIAGAVALETISAHASRLSVMGGAPSR